MLLAEKWFAGRNLPTPVLTRSDYNFKILFIVLFTLLAIVIIEEIN